MDSELFTRHWVSFDLSVYKTSESKCSMVNGERHTWGQSLADPNHTCGVHEQVTGTAFPSAPSEDSWEISGI